MQCLEHGPGLTGPPAQVYRTYSLEADAAVTQAAISAGLARDGMKPGVSSLGETRYYRRSTDHGCVSVGVEIKPGQPLTTVRIDADGDDSCPPGA